MQDLIESISSSDAENKDSSSSSSQIEEEKSKIESEFDFIHKTFFKPSILTFIEQLEECGNSKLS